MSGKPDFCTIFADRSELSDSRFLPPGDMPGSIQAFCRETGQLIPETHAEIVRRILESLALEYRNVADRISNLLGR